MKWQAVLLLIVRSQISFPTSRLDVLPVFCQSFWTNSWIYLKKGHDYFHFFLKSSLTITPSQISFPTSRPDVLPVFYQSFWTNSWIYLKIGHDYFHFFLKSSLTITLPFTVFKVTSTYIIEESSSNAMRTLLSSERGVAEMRCVQCSDSATAVHARS